MRKILILIFVLSCSSMQSINQVIQSEAVLEKNFGSESAAIKLKRYSWFFGAIMDYEVLIGQIPSGSGFEKYVKATEPNLLKNCQKRALLMAYVNNTTRRTNSSFFSSAFQDQAKVYVSLPFKMMMKSHYFTNKHHLSMHRVSLVCLDKSLKVDVPNFETVELNP